MALRPKGKIEWVVNSEEIMAFILTRPLGAVVGDFLDKPTNAGGMGISRYSASIIHLVAMTILILVIPAIAAALNFLRK